MSIELSDCTGTDERRCCGKCGEGILGKWLENYVEELGG